MQCPDHTRRSLLLIAPASSACPAPKPARSEAENGELRRLFSRRLFDDRCLEPWVGEEVFEHFHHNSIPGKAQFGPGPDVWER
jgi:hypothetical protein